MKKIIAGFVVSTVGGPAGLVIARVGKKTVL